jgi:hypothetical protein
MKDAIKKVKEVLTPKVKVEPKKVVEEKVEVADPDLPESRQRHLR